MIPNCEFVDSLDEPKYKISKGLKKLREAGLLLAEKEGRWVYHRLVTETAHHDCLFQLIANLVDVNGVYARDYSRFKARLTYREGGRCQVALIPGITLDLVREKR